MTKKAAATFATLLFFSSALSVDAASVYKVQKGDTLTAIAKKHKSTISAFKEENHLTSSHIFIGQVLKVPSAPVKKQPVNTIVSAATTESAGTYKVVQGDNLTKIASKFGVTITNLREWNNLKSDFLSIGQVLKVKLIAKAADQPAPTSTPAPAAVTVTEYTVKSGDTLSKISRQFGVAIDKIKSLNNLSSDNIQVGQKLKLTGTAPAASIPVSKVVDIAKSLIGVPYVWGGNTPSGFDCSGFIYYVENKAGKTMKRYSSAGYYDRSYYVSNPQPGDLVFFENTYTSGISHMGIYIGNNQFMHADSSRGIAIANLSNSYYKQHFDSFKRFY